MAVVELMRAQMLKVAVVVSFLRVAPARMALLSLALAAAMFKELHRGFQHGLPAGVAELMP
jgi:hypothetical protein